MSLRYENGGRERVLKQGLALAGLEEAPEAEIILDGLAAMAAAWCGREDIPAGMEWALAVLLSRQLKGQAERPVTQVKRGDTAITYGEGPGGLELVKLLLAPFVRLGTPKEENRYG